MDPLPCHHAGPLLTSLTAGRKETQMGGVRGRGLIGGRHPKGLGPAPLRPGYRRCQRPPQERTRPDLDPGLSGGPASLCRNSLQFRESPRIHCPMPHTSSRLHPALCECMHGTQGLAQGWGTQQCSRCPAPLTPNRIVRFTPILQNSLFRCDPKRPLRKGSTHLWAVRPMSLSPLFKAGGRVVSFF